MGAVENAFPFSISVTRSTVSGRLSRIMVKFYADEKPSSWSMNDSVTAHLMWYRMIAVNPHRTRAVLTFLKRELVKSEYTTAQEARYTTSMITKVVFQYF